MTPRTSTENERIREDQRRNILDAAAKLCARRGLAATRISDIAQAAGVSHGLVHHYFGTKNELFAAIIESVLGNATAVADEAFALDATPWERLEFVVGQMMLGVRHAPELYIVVQAVSNESVPEEIRHRAMELGAAGSAAIAEVIAAAQASGDVRPGDPVEFAGYLGAMAQGLAINVMAATIDGSAAEVPLPSPQMVLGMLRVCEEGTS